MRGRGRGLFVVVRGGGELGTGVAYRLFTHGMRVAVTEKAQPTAERRMVAFAEAVYRGEVHVEGVAARRVSNPQQALEASSSGVVAVLVDEEGHLWRRLHPDIFVDAIMAKRNTGTGMRDAPIVIGLGPGFKAGVDVHAAIETRPGPRLGEVLYRGETEEDTGVPYTQAGYSFERLLKAPRDGLFHAAKGIGEPVGVGETVGWVDGEPVVSHIRGIVAGLLHNGIPVRKGEKMGDVIPLEAWDEEDAMRRATLGAMTNPQRMSERARIVGKSVLEAILTVITQIHL